jgi:hypothetical protein
MTRRQERVLLWILVFNALMMVVAPIGGSSVIQPLSALFAGHAAPGAKALGQATR